MRSLVDGNTHVLLTVYLYAFPVKLSVVGIWALSTYSYIFPSACCSPPIIPCVDRIRLHVDSKRISIGKSKFCGNYARTFKIQPGQMACIIET